MIIKWIGCVHCFSFTSAFLMLTVLAASCNTASQEEFDLTRFFEIWKEYISYPSSENAKRVSALLPDTGRVILSGGKEELGVLIEIEDNLPMLERQVYASDQEAVRLAFRLLTTVADGSFAEALDIMLGALIRINPRLFLEESSNYRHLIVRLDALTGNFGGEYVDRIKAECLEANLRIEVLEGISDAELVEVRDECIESLRELLELLEKNERILGID